MKKYKFGICGAFDFEEKSTGGQSVKTREFYYALCDFINQDQILTLESTSYKRNPFTFFVRFLRLIKQCENVIVFPAQKGIKVFAPLCAFWGNIYKTKIHYNVIGGWLSNLIKSNNSLKKHLLKFDSILVETSTMKNELELLGFNNVYRIANFKSLKAVNEIKSNSDPIKLCYFSRVAELKGIEDAIKVVKQLNSNITQCTLDIYGPIVEDYKQRFNEISSSFNDLIKYRGVINPSDSVDTLKKYDLQLFPTRYSTEGIPGSILDGYFAGVPVVAARWNSFSDVVKDGVTGVGFEQCNLDSFYNCLLDLINNQEIILNMKENCLKEAMLYDPRTVIQQFLNIVNGECFGDKSV